MKNSQILAFLTGGLVAASVQAQGYVEGLNFVVTHNTSINQIGVFDGGSPLTGDIFVGVFNDATGNLVGPDLEFGPGAAAAGISGAQIGSTYFENTAAFTLAPGEYSIIATGAKGGSGGLGLSGVGESFELNGTIYTLPTGTGTEFQSASYALHDPPLTTPVNSVPDGGMTAMLLGASFAGLGLIRRKV
jgi:VPDSG-CTERM motif